jgi:dTDP-4-amino-4,6-dideoxygalactose transaminase
MSRAALGWLPSAGMPIDAAQILGLFRERDPARELARRLRERLSASEVALRASGRDALACLLDSAARESGRDEVVVPAYTCYSVPAAAAAVGLRVRLVDVGPSGQIDLAALAALPLARACAIVVCNLFGIAEPVAPIRSLAERHGALVIDDAAQAFGAEAADGLAGARGHAGVLSFGRGKPLSGLGGGAFALTDWPARIPSVGAAQPSRARAVLRAALYNLALRPLAFRLLASIPALGIGETHYALDFRRGPIDASAVALAASALPHAAAAAERRAARSHHLAACLTERSALVPLLPPVGSRAVFPRLFALAPDAESRDASLAALRRAGAGATAMYPSSLDRLAALAPARIGDADCPGARELAARLITLPTHEGLAGPRLARALAALAAVCPRRGSAAR